MTKRKHAAPSVTAHIGSTARNPLHNSEGLHSTSSAPTSAVKKTKVTKESGSAAVAGLATAKDLDIDDIFKRARGTKRILVNTEKVCMYYSGSSSAQDCRWQRKLLLTRFSCLEGKGSEQSTKGGGQQR